jgi:hypothetical protein
MKITERMVDDVAVLDADARMTRNEGCGMTKTRTTQLIDEWRRNFLITLPRVSYMDSTCVGARS